MRATVTFMRRDKTMIELAILSLLGLGFLAGPFPLEMLMGNIGLAEEDENEDADIQTRQPPIGHCERHIWYDTQRTVGCPFARANHRH